MYKCNKLQINVIYGIPGIVQESNVTTTRELRNLGKLVRIQHQPSMPPTHLWNSRGKRRRLGMAVELNQQ
ncbi:hypothetical protein SLE2022_322370 [Rubroshorea leprosula]